MKKFSINIFSALMIVCICLFGTANVFAEEIIIDNNGVGYEELATMNPGTGGIGSNHRIGKGAKYTPNLSDGVYKVSIYVPYANYVYAYCKGTVKHSRGITEFDLAELDLKEVGWYDLGDFTFRADDEKYFMYSVERVVPQ